MTNIHRTGLVVSSLMAGLGPLVGNALYEGPSGKGDQLMTELSGSLPVSAYVGIGLELTGFVALVVFLGVLTALLGRRAPVSAATTAIAGAAMVAVKLGSIAPMMALRIGPDRVDPGVAEVMIDLGSAAFVISGLLLSLALAAAGVGLVRSGVVANWLAWWPAVAGSLGVLAGGIGIVAPESYLPIPFLLLLVWMIVLGITTVVRSSAVANVVDRPLVTTQ